MVAVLDCASAAGDALSAIRQGLHVILFNDNKVINDKITDIASQCGAIIVTKRPPSLDLGELELDSLDLTAICRNWLRV